MANEQNLIPFTSDQDREEARKNGKKGGKASGEARRKKKTFKNLSSSFLKKVPYALLPIAKSLKTVSSRFSRDIKSRLTNSVF